MIRQYERIGTESTESVLVHVTSDGYVKMTADNLDELLQHLGYRRTNKEHA